jgi:hypothetical protein
VQVISTPWGVQSMFPVPAQRGQAPMMMGRLFVLRDDSNLRSALRVGSGFSAP